MAVRAARLLSWRDALAMTPRQIEAFLHFSDAVDLQNEFAAIQTGRLAQADQKTLEKYERSVLPR